MTTVVSNTSKALESPYEDTLKRLLSDARAEAVESSVSELERLAISHDASHYLLVPAGMVRPDSAEDVANIFRAAGDLGLPLTFRSGGTSLSASPAATIMVDTRRHFKKIEVLEDGKKVRVQPGATIMMVNNYLAPYGYKLYPTRHLGPPAPSVAWSRTTPPACLRAPSTTRTTPSTPWC